MIAASPTNYWEGDDENDEVTDAGATFRLACPTKLEPLQSFAAPADPLLKSQCKHYPNLTGIDA